MFNVEISKHKRAFGNNPSFAPKLQKKTKGKPTVNRRRRGSHCSRGSQAPADGNSLCTDQSHHKESKWKENLVKEKMKKANLRKNLVETAALAPFHISGESANLFNTE